MANSSLCPARGFLTAAVLLIALYSHAIDKVLFTGAIAWSATTPTMRDDSQESHQQWRESVERRMEGFSNDLCPSGDVEQSRPSPALCCPSRRNSFLKPAQHDRTSSALEPKETSASSAERWNHDNIAEGKSEDLVQPRGDSSPHFSRTTHLHQTVGNFHLDADSDRQTWLAVDSDSSGKQSASEGRFGRASSDEASSPNRNAGEGDGKLPTPNEADLRRRIARCHDFDESELECNLQPRCLYLAASGEVRPSTPSKTGSVSLPFSNYHRGADAGTSELESIVAADGVSQLLHRTDKESLHLLSMRFGKARCIVNPAYMKEIVNSRCKMESKGNLMGISRDLFRDGLLSQEVVQHLRQRFDLDYICRTICHAYFSDPYINQLMLSQIHSKYSPDGTCREASRNRTVYSSFDLSCIESSWNLFERWEKLSVILSG